MEDNINTNEEETVLNPEDVLVAMEANTVPKSKYDELERRFNKFFQARASGLVLPEEEKPETEEEASARIVKLIKEQNPENGKTLGTCNRMKALLDLDDYLTSHGKRSCFSPSKGDITEDQEIANESLRTAMRTALERGNGDDEATAASFASFLK